MLSDELGVNTSELLIPNLCLMFKLTNMMKYPTESRFFIKPAFLMTYQIYNLKSIIYKIYNLKSKGLASW